MRFPVPALAFMLCAVAYAAQPPFVTCAKGPASFRSDVVRAKGQRAYAVTESHPDARWSCANTARLYVAAAGKPFAVVYTITPKRIDDSADSLMPVAWSPDGRWLAVEALYAGHLGSDSAAYGLLIYDAQTGRVKEINCDFSAAISQMKHTKCELQLRAVDGFDSAGRVRLRLADAIDEEGLSDRCVGRDSTWLLNPEAERFRAAR